MAGWWRNVRTRLVLRACDAILTAGLQVERRQPPPRGSRSNYSRMRDLARVTHLFLPAAMGWLRRQLRRHHLLPFVQPVSDVLGFGTGSTVFLLRNRPGAQRADMVMKVYRRTLGRPLPDLLRHAGAYRERYQTVSRWYAGTSIIVPTTFLLLQGPLLGQPAVAAMQPYLGGEKWDLFELVAVGDVAAHTLAHPSFHAELRSFVERTVAVYDGESMCLDLVGRDNVLVVREEGELRLRVIDFGVFDLRVLRERAPHRAAIVAARRTRLVRLYEEIYGADPSAVVSGARRS